MSNVGLAVEQLGGPSAVSIICNVTPQAVRKWVNRGRLPRTEYTGETQHAQRMASASGGAFTAEWLLEHAAPSAIEVQLSSDEPTVTPS
ncbi:hypothetical protein CZ787_17205 [Halomonas citrativorans]|uniref:Uncharacterized protein n=1 Tax=Halomonas citrativorans TaxID=2742612 RepID=A0A1R4I532_9GAMM|nr:hypothetical protein [Halomonas citrativorans]SJN14849.1 hypothetical protein CZ787_17205 [Halomonas citrativorans]